LLLAQILPAVMFASLTTIVFTGLLNRYGQARPELTGNGTLQKGEHDDIGLLNAQPDSKIGPHEIAAAGITAITLYLIGLLGQTLFKFPGPITMLILAIGLNLARAITPRMKAGAYAYYKFFSSAVTYPLLFAIGVALTPWDKLIAAFTPAMVVTIIASVAALMTTGFFVGQAMGMYPIEAAIVTGCRASQGDRRRRHPHRLRPAPADALRPDRDAHRRGGDGDAGARIAAHLWLGVHPVRRQDLAYFM
jgi:Na+/citrate or Na+/malate symporter